MSKKTIGSDLFLIDFFSTYTFIYSILGLIVFKNLKLFVVITKLNSDARGNKLIINLMRI